MMGRHITGLLCIRMIDTLMTIYAREIDNIHVLLLDTSKKLPHCAADFKCLRLSFQLGLKRTEYQGLGLMANSS